MTTLVTIGCSHTAGSMIDGRTGTSWHNKHNSFGGLLAEKYKMSHYNLGVPGGSNEYIYRGTIRFINNFMHDIDDYIFLIGWTSTQRMELRYPEQSHYVHKMIGDFLDQKYIPFTLGTDPKLYHTREAKELTKFAPLLFYDKLLENDWAMYAYTLQQLFKNRNLKYYMMNTCHDLPVNDTNKLFVDNLDTNFYYNPTDFDSSMLYYALNKGYEKTECWHLKADGHLMWAEHLDELMLAQGLFDNITKPQAIPKNDSIRISGKTISRQIVQDILHKYKIDARIFMDSVYDNIYLEFPRLTKGHLAQIQINMINKDLIRKFGPTAKISKYYCMENYAKDFGLHESDDTFMLEHFRKMT